MVKAGATLWKIAQAHGTTIQAIVQTNRIAIPNNIYPGLTLYIPAALYTIMPGDTLGKVARRFGETVHALMKTNDIENPDLIYPGMVLVIPRRNKPVIEVNGYIRILGEDATPIVREIGEHLTYLSPFAYRVREDINLQPIKDAEAAAAAVE